MAARDRWTEVSPSAFEHERHGLALARAMMPEAAPYRAWSNFEFRDSSGGWHECDLLVLGPGALYLIELKHYRGVLTGNDHDWTRGGRTERSPLLLCRRKAQRLASRLKDSAVDLARTRGADEQLARRTIPFVQEAVFLTSDELRCQLPMASMTGLFGPAGAERRTNLPPLTDLITRAPRPGTVINDDVGEILTAILAAIGVQRRQREAGSWRLDDEVHAEGVDVQGQAWQEWLGEHTAFSERRGRLRFPVIPQGASDADRRRLTQVAKHEFAQTDILKHEGILVPTDMVQAELGPGLVYPYDPDWERLDLWLASRPTLPVDMALDLVRQVGEAVRFAHEHGVAHRGLGAGAVWVKGTEHGASAQVREWSLSGNVSGTRTGVTRLVAPGSGPFAVPEDEAWLTGAFSAPELTWSAEDRIRLDVFSLGALAYYLVSGRAPAPSQAELIEVLAQRGDGLDLSLVTPVSAELRELVRRATHPQVNTRHESVQDFLSDLSAVAKGLAAPVPAEVLDPLDAAPGDTVGGGRFTVAKRLGRGSTAQGLLVTDDQRGGAAVVLKVALDPRAERRIAAEATTLRLLPARAPHFARLLEGPVDLGERQALVLESAGSHTLSNELRAGRGLSMDFLERWGQDLLTALVELERLGIDHRDIKPSNLGVRLDSDKRPRLVLFDFSLARAAAGDIEAGTPPYRDPFLGQGTRQQFDSAAELYSAAVVLFEMATGHVPQFGDGATLPTLTEGEATIDPDELDPQLAGDLAAFFRRALRRDAAARFHTAVEMRDAWTRIFATDATTHTPTDADDEAAQAATLTTPLAQAGITARGLSALARFGVVTVQDFLLKVDPMENYSRVAGRTKSHLKQRHKEWRARFGADLPRAQVGSIDAGAKRAVELLVATCGPGNAVTRRAVVSLVLGVGSPAVPAFASPQELRDTFRGKDAKPPLDRVQEALPEAVRTWASDPASRELLDAVKDAVDVAVTEAGGAITVAEACAAVLRATGTTGREPQDLRRAEGLLRVALERRKALRQVQVDDGEEPVLPVSVRRLNGRVALLGDRPELFEPMTALGRAADALLTAPGVPEGVVVPAVQAASALGEALAPYRAADRELPDSLLRPERMLRVGAELSQRAQVAQTLDLHRDDLPQHAAVREALRNEAGRFELSPQDVRERTEARFPSLRTAPSDWARPHLDEVLQLAGLPLAWQDLRGTYASQRPPQTTGLTSLLTRPAADGTGSLRDATEHRLQESARTRSFLALGVPGHKMAALSALLVSRWDAEVLDVTGLILAEMRAAAERLGASWDTVMAADAAAAAPGDRRNLGQLVAASLDPVWAGLQDRVDAGGAPLLLTDLAPLARYGHLHELSRFTDLTARRGRAVWALVPQLATAQGPVVDGVPLPLDSPGQFLRVDGAWPGRVGEQREHEDEETGAASATRATERKVTR